MGNARARGSYEQRKEQAITARRTKKSAGLALLPKAGLPIGGLLEFFRLRAHKPAWLIKEEAQRAHNRAKKIAAKKAA